MVMVTVMVKTVMRKLLTQILTTIETEKHKVKIRLQILQRKQVCDDPGNGRDDQIKNGDGDDDDDEVGKMDNEQTEEKVFDCPEDGCIAKFTTFGRLQNHVTRGIHHLKPERITMKDYALKLYSEKIEHVQMDRIIQPLRDVIHEMTETENAAYVMKPLQQGWALPLKKTRNPFTENVKNYLDEKFMEGERTKKNSIQKK